MVGTIEDAVQEKGARLHKWIERDLSRASPADLALLGRQLTLAGAPLGAVDDAPRSDAAPQDELWLAAVKADQQGADGDHLDGVWLDLAHGRAKLVADWYGPTRSYAVAAVLGDGAPTGDRLSDVEGTVLVRILCGTQQKVLADDFRLAHSTVSKRHTTALRKLHVDGQPIPLTVVLAALRSEKLVEVRAARRATFVHQNRTHVVVSVPRPRVPSPSRLTMAEREIALQLLEGQSRHQIAVARRASVQTVSCQLRTIFAKLRVSGRFAAMRRAGEQGWFEGA